MRDSPSGSTLSPERLAEQERLNALSKDVLDAAIEVHRGLGPGLLESAYSAALLHELRLRHLEVQREVAVEADWKGQPLGLAFRADLIVSRCLLVELKAVTKLEPVFAAQTRTDLKLLDFRLGLLINFNQSRLLDGYQRVVNDF